MSGRVVLVTGAAGHLGRAVAAAFAADGERLVVAGRSLQELGKAFRSGPDCRLVAVDLLDAEAVRAALDAAAEAFGRLDAVCNLAGGFAMGPAVHETDDNAWRRMHDLNVRTARNVLRAAVPHLLRAGRGQVVNVGAFSALKGAAGMGAYVASKAEVIRMTETMALELRDRGVNVNCVLPTILDTADNRAAMPDADPSKWVPLPALAEVVKFLCSDAARAIHGAAIPVTGLS